MKFVRLLSRLAILLLVAGALVGLAAIYGSYTHPEVREAEIRAMGPAAFARWQAELLDQPSAPEAGYFSDFIGYASFLGVFCLAGRVLFRLRLSPAPRGERQPIFLDLRQERQQPLHSSPAPAHSPPPARC